MTAGEALLASGVFVVFGAVGVLMLRSAITDWREGRRERDGASLILAA